MLRGKPPSTQHEAGHFCTTAKVPTPKDNGQSRVPSPPTPPARRAPGRFVSLRRFTVQWCSQPRRRKRRTPNLPASFHDGFQERRKCLRNGVRASCMHPCMHFDIEVTRRRYYNRLRPLGQGGQVMRVSVGSKRFDGLYVAFLPGVYTSLWKTRWLLILIVRSLPLRGDTCR